MCSPRSIRNVLALWVLALAGSAALAGPGELDLRFGTRGWVELPQIDTVGAVVAEPGGSVVIAGHKWPANSGALVNPQPEVLVLHVSPSGGVFWTQTLGSGYATAARRLQSGRILVGFYTSGPSSGRIVALRPDGVIDTSFSDQGQLTLTRSSIVTDAGNGAAVVAVESIRELPGGDLLVSATVADDTISTAWDPATLGLLFRVSADGRLLDPPAPKNALLSQRFLAGVEVLPDGRGLVAAANGCCSNLGALLLSRATSGELSATRTAFDARSDDSGWYGDNVALTVDAVRQRFYVRGPSNSEPTLFAVDPAGTPDPSFAGSGSVKFPPLAGPGALHVDDLGAIVSVSGSRPMAWDADIPQVLASRAGLLVSRWTASGSADGLIDGGRLVPLADRTSRSSTGRVHVAQADAGYAWVAAMVTTASGDAVRLARLQLRAGTGSGAVGFQLGDLRIAENGSPSFATVVRSGGSTGAVSVRYEVVGSTGNGLNPVSGILNWSDGDASPRSIQISAPNDAQLEGEQSQTVRLFDASGGATVVAPPITVTIEDDEALARLSVAASTAQINAGQEARFVVTLNQPAPAPVSVIAVIGDAIDSTGMARYAARNSSGWTAQTLSWGAGQSGDRVVALPTNRNSDPNYAGDLYLRLVTSDGVLVRTAPGGEAMGATIKVVASTQPVSSGNPTPPSNPGRDPQGGGGGGTDLLTIALLGGLLAARRRSYAHVHADAWRTRRAIRDPLAAGSLLRSGGR